MHKGGVAFVSTANLTNLSDDVFADEASVLCETSFFCRCTGHSRSDFKTIRFINWLLGFGVKKSRVLSMGPRGLLVSSAGCTLKERLLRSLYKRKLSLRLFSLEYKSGFLIASYRCIA